MNPHRSTLHLLFLFLIVSFNSVFAQKHKAPPGGRIAVVIDERLSALRATPELSGKLVRRLGRGRLVAIRVAKSRPDGLVFYLVNVSTRTHGWIQREAVVSPFVPGDDKRLLELVNSSSGFDRIVQARIFLDNFVRSPYRAQVLLAFGDAAEQVTEKLSQDAARRIPREQAALQMSYFLNYVGLDRYNRQGATFVFDRKASRFHYDGSAWREILRRFPHSPQATEARKRLAELAVSISISGG